MAELTCSQAPRACDHALARAFAFLGKRWNGVILGTLALGGASFSEISRAVDGISDSMLSERLNELAVAGLIVRTVGDERPVSVTYTLSPAGQALLPALDELTKWAAANLPAVASAPAPPGLGPSDSPGRVKARPVRPPALST